MKSRILGAVALSLALAVPALAADLPSRKAPAYLPPPPPPPLWTGFYVGLNAGGTWAESNNLGVVSYPLVPGAVAAQLAALASAPVPVGNSGGFIGGGQIGYNFQFANNFVVGIEADIQGVTHSGNAGTASTFGAINGFPVVTTLSATKNIDYLGTVRGRLGWLFTPTLLVYGTGGLAYGGVNTSASVVQLGITNGFVGVGGIGAFSDTRVGWTAGGGVEWLFLPNWSAKVEYLYYDLGSVYTNGSLLGGIPAIPYAGVQSTPRFDGHIVRAGVNYHFNWGAPAPVVAKY